MNELTRIITVQITAIGKVPAEKLEAKLKSVNDQEVIRDLEETLKIDLGVDDAKIISTQDFVLEKGGSNG